jgi:hypothetical protein
VARLSKWCQYSRYAQNAETEFQKRRIIALNADKNNKIVIGAVAGI